MMSNMLLLSQQITKDLDNPLAELHLPNINEQSNPHISYDKTFRHRHDT